MFDVHRFRPTGVDLGLLLAAIVPGMAAAPDPQSTIDLAHMLMPLAITAASAFGGMLAKSFVVGFYGYARATGRKMLRDDNPKNDALGHTLVEIADRNDPDGAKPDDDEEHPAAAPCPPSAQALAPPGSSTPVPSIPAGVLEAPKKGPEP